MPWTNCDSRALTVLLIQWTCMPTRPSSAIPMVAIKPMIQRRSMQLNYPSLRPWIKLNAL